MELKVLVASCGRSGSVYFAKLLTQVGIPCGHECLFDYRGYKGLVERLSGQRRITNSPISIETGKWVLARDIVAESSYAAAPFMSSQICKAAKQIHLVRHPMKVITSFTRDFKYFVHSIPGLRSQDIEWQQFIYEHLPELSQISNQMERAAYFYVNWNRMIQQNKGNRYFLHKIESPIEPALDFLEVPRQSIAVPNDTNSRSQNKPFFPFRAIPNGSIRRDLLGYAESLGYDIEIKAL